MKWLNHEARFDALDMIYFASVVGFAAFLVAASVFVGLGTDPGTLPVWIQTVFVAGGTLIALIKYNYDRLKKREEAIAAELIAASRMSGAIQRVLTRMRHIKMWMEIRDDMLKEAGLVQSSSDSQDDHDADDGEIDDETRTTLDRIDAHLQRLQDQILGKVRGDVMAPAVQEIGDHISFINPVRAMKILECKRSIEDFRACVFAVDEHVSPVIAFYDLDVFPLLDRVKYLGTIALAQIKGIKNSAPESLATN